MSNTVIPRYRSDFTPQIIALRQQTLGTLIADLSNESAHYKTTPALKETIQPVITIANNVICYLRQYQNKPGLHQAIPQEYQLAIQEIKEKIIQILTFLKARNGRNETTTTSPTATLAAAMNSLALNSGRSERLRVKKG